jgi:hypothetical protein
VAGQGSCIALASWYPKACRSITSLCFAVDASDQSASRYCKRLVPTNVRELCLLTLTRKPTLAGQCWTLDLWAELRVDTHGPSCWLGQTMLAQAWAFAPMHGAHSSLYSPSESRGVVNQTEGNPQWLAHWSGLAWVTLLSKGDSAVHHYARVYTRHDHQEGQKRGTAVHRPKHSRHILCTDTLTTTKYREGQCVRDERAKCEEWRRVFLQHIALL